MTLDRYNPSEPPKPSDWLAIDEQERLDLVQDFHRRAGIPLPQAALHATIHVVVENQIALGDELPVRRTTERMMAEGLDRHQAIHAIGSVLATFVHDLASGRWSNAFPEHEYFAALERLTAQGWLDSAELSDADPQHPLIAQLAAPGSIPVETIRGARADRPAATRVFLQAIERYLAGQADPETVEALFWIFHLFGEWREKSAYRLLALLMRQPDEELAFILGDAVTESSHRVMAAVFDGDAKPLYDAILDRNADEYARSQMCEALAMVALRGELPREEAARFLRTSFAQLEPEGGNFVWHGWQSAIALLGLDELKPLVELAFARGYIAREWLSLEDFAEDLSRPNRGMDDKYFSLFGDTIEEFSGWTFSDAENPAGKETQPHWDEPMPQYGPAVNPFRDIGRNDDCPCGSGKKFKKCCLGKANAGLIGRT